VGEVKSCATGVKSMSVQTHIRTLDRGPRPIGLCCVISTVGTESAFAKTPWTWARAPWAHMIRLLDFEQTSGAKRSRVSGKNVKLSQIVSHSAAHWMIFCRLSLQEGHWRRRFRLHHAWAITTTTPAPTIGGHGVGAVSGALSPAPTASAGPARRYCRSALGRHSCSSCSLLVVLIAIIQQETIFYAVVWRDL